MVTAFENLLLSLCVLQDKDMTSFYLEKVGRSFLMVDHACHILLPPGNSGDSNLRIMTGMLVILLSGRNCRSSLKTNKFCLLLEPIQDWSHLGAFKTESIRKMSNFNFQWTTTLYQNNLKNIAFFFTFFKGYRCNQLSQ